MKSYMASPATIERKWYVVDATGYTLGRLASEVAKILRGKNKPIFTPFIDTGDYVIITNADKIKVTGKKLEQKDLIYDPSTVNLAAYTRLTLPMPEHLTAEGAEVFASMLRFLQRASAHICPNCMAWCNPWDGTARFAEGSCYLARMARCICREVASLYTESWNKL